MQEKRAAHNNGFASCGVYLRKVGKTVNKKKQHGWIEKRFK